MSLFFYTKLHVVVSIRVLVSIGIGIDKILTIYIPTTLQAYLKDPDMYVLVPCFHMCVILNCVTVLSNVHCPLSVSLPPGSSPYTVSHCHWIWHVGCGMCSAEMARSSCSALRWACCVSIRMF